MSDLQQTGCDIALGNRPLQSDEIEVLNLPPDAIRRLRYLILQEQRGELSVLERFQLDAFKEAAFYLRMASRHKRDTIS